MEECGRPLRHADATSWRTDGKNGYVWLFATPSLSIFPFVRNGSSQVVHAVFGKDRLPCVLVVDRYGGYNKVPCDTNAFPTRATLAANFFRYERLGLTALQRHAASRPKSLV